MGIREELDAVVRRRRDADGLPAEAERRIRTTMVGAIAAHEEIFGWLYGACPPPFNPTEEEEAVLCGLRDVFGRLHRVLRNRIFDLGNDQIKYFYARNER